MESFLSLPGRLWSKITELSKLVCSTVALSSQRLVMLVAQKKLLRLGEKDIGEPCKAHLIPHNTLDVKLALKLFEKVLLGFYPPIPLAKAFKIA